MTLSREPNSGGHHHLGGPPGSISPARFQLQGPWPQNIEVMYTAPDASGLVEQLATFDSGTVDYDYNNVMIQGLVELTGNAHIKIIHNDPYHPKVHYGTPAMLQGIRELAKAFFNTYNKKVEVNDMSLPRGGLFDYNGNWVPPHQTHRTGINADIQTRNVSETERAYLKAKGEELGFRMLHEDDPPHFHVTLL